MLTLLKESAQLAFTCSKLMIETLEQGMKYVQSSNMFGHFYCSAKVIQKTCFEQQTIGLGDC